MNDINPEEMEALADSIGSVLADGCDSLALHAFYNDERDLGAELHDQAIDLGWLMIALPEAAGGLGLGAAGAVLLHRELGRVAAPGDLLSDLVGLEVLAASGQDAAQGLIDQVLSGSTRLAIAARPRDPASRLFLGSPAAGFALAAHGENDVALIDLSGVAATPAEFWDRSRNLFELPDLAGLPVASLPVTVLPGVRTVLEDAMALAIAADCVGLAHGIANRTLTYMKEREQFGRSIASFQALKHRMADIFKTVTTNGHLVAHAVETATLASPMASTWAGQAKATASDMAVFVSADCVQLHGGVGYTWEYDPHIFLKRARLNQVLLDDNGPLRDRAFAAMAQATRDGIDVLEIA